MAETLDKELDNMEEVTEGSNPVTKNAKPGDPIDTSKAGGVKKVVDVEGPVGASAEGAKGTKNAALLLQCSEVTKAINPSRPKGLVHPLKWRKPKMAKKKQSLKPKTTLLKMLTLLSLVKNYQKSSE